MKKIIVFLFLSILIKCTDKVTVKTTSDDNVDGGILARKYCFSCHAPTKQLSGKSLTRIGYVYNSKELLKYSMRQFSIEQNDANLSEHKLFILDSLTIIKIVDYIEDDYINK